MSQKSKSLTYKVWLSFILFSIAILTFLWLFQVIFLDSFYEKSKRIALFEVSEQIKSSYNKNEFFDVLDDLSFERGVCIEVVSNNILVYMSNHFDYNNTLDENKSQSKAIAIVKGIVQYFKSIQ